MHIIDFHIQFAFVSAVDKDNGFSNLWTVFDFAHIIEWYSCGVYFDDSKLQPVVNTCECVGIDGLNGHHTFIMYFDFLSNWQFAVVQLLHRFCDHKVDIPIVGAQVYLRCIPI